jgi:hypothetical protein
VTTPTLVYAPAFQAGLLFSAARRFEAGTQHLSQALADATAAFSGATQAVGASIAELRSLSDSLGTVGTGLTGVVDRLGTIADGVGQLNEKFSRLLDLPALLPRRDTVQITTRVSGSVSSSSAGGTISTTDPAQWNPTRTYPAAPTPRQGAAVLSDRLAPVDEGLRDLALIPGAKPFAERARLGVRTFQRIDEGLTWLSNNGFRKEVESWVAQTDQMRQQVDQLVKNPNLRQEDLTAARERFRRMESEYGSEHRVRQRRLDEGHPVRSDPEMAVMYGFFRDVAAWGKDMLADEAVRRGWTFPPMTFAANREPERQEPAFNVRQTATVARDPSLQALEALVGRANALLRNERGLNLTDPAIPGLREQMGDLASELQAFASRRGDQDELGSLARSWAGRLEVHASLPVIQVVTALAPVTGPRPEVRGLRVEPLKPNPPPAPPQPGGLMQFAQGGLQQLGQFAKESGEMLKGGLQGAVMSLSPLGMVATLLEGVFAGMAPILEAFSSPLRIVGELLGTLIAPVLRIFFPIIKTVAIAFTYAGQIIANVIGGIAKVAGEVISAVGSIIRRIPLLGGVGRSIQNFGRGIVAASRDAFAVAGQMSEARDRLRDLTFEEAMDNVGEAAAEAAESLSNVPNAYRMLGARRWEASEGVAAVRSSAPLPVAVSADSSAATQSNTIYVHNEINAREYTPREMMRAVIDEAKREARALFGDSTRWSEVM